MVSSMVVLLWVPAQLLLGVVATGIGLAMWLLLEEVVMCGSVVQAATWNAFPLHCVALLRLAVYVALPATAERPVWPDHMIVSTLGTLS